MNFDFTDELRAHITANLAALEPTLREPGGLRHAAVGVVLLPDSAGRACFVLTRRLATLRRHSGQWALPGGRLDVGEVPATAALREIHEEVGLDLPADAVLGRLDDFVSRSGHLISPLVVWAAEHAGLVASPDEVRAVYRVPLEELDHPGSLSLEPLLHFALMDTTVYAPTAAILYQFREVGLRGRDVHFGHIEQPFFAWQ
ncbi:MAG TPA: CoA pyrophosphatase [Chloroflexota bacterium]|nr:CoA pyrophosphatase [Chloroflexota bacterium]